MPIDDHIRALLTEHNRALEEEHRYGRHGNTLSHQRSNATGEAIIEYVRKTLSEHQTLDVFYRLTVKERDLARFQLARLRAGIVDSVAGRAEGDPGSQALG